MRLNGKEIGQWQIVTRSPEEFNEVFNKLRQLGFVYATERYKTSGEITNIYGWYATILIGNDSYCKAVLHGRNNPKENISIVTLEEFLTNHFPAYWAA